MKSLKKIIIVIFVAVVLLVVCRNYILKSVIEGGARMVTGLKLSMDKFDLGASKVYIRDLKLYNPSGFSDPVMVDIPEILIDYELADLLKGSIHLSEMRLHLKEILIEKNKDGKLNVDTLKQMQPAKSEDRPKTESEKKPAKPIKIAVDNLSLHVERVVYKDYSVPGSDGPTVKNFEINLHEEAKNIQDLNVVITMIFFKALSRTSIAALTNLNMNGLDLAASEAIKGVTQTAGKVLDGTTGKAKEALSTTTEELKNIIKNPFGKK